MTSVGEIDEVDAQPDENAPRRALSRRIRPWEAIDVVVVATLLIGAGLGGSIPEYYLYIASLGGLYVLVAIGNNLLLAHAGIVSLGQGALFGAGAYAAAIGANRGWGFVPSAVFAVAAALVASLLVGLPAIRLRGHYLALVTLALALSFGEIITVSPSLTGGSAGFPVVSGILAPIPLFAVICVVVAIAVWSQDRLIRGRFGVTLRLVRDSESAARSCGISVPKYKIIAFGYSGVLAGVAGALFPSLTGYVAPSSFDLWLSIYILAAVVIGGMFSPVGAMLGGAFVAVLPQLVSQYQGLTAIIFGVALLVVIFLLEKRALLERLSSRKVASRAR